MTFFIAMFVLLMQFLWRYIDDLVGKGLESSIIAELLSYASFGLIPMALPLAILLSSIMTFGNLGEHYELTAMKSSGISLYRIMFPLIILTIIISISAFFFSNNILPHTNRKTYALLYDIKNQRPELDIQEGIFNNDLNDYTIKISHRNRETDMMYDFMIYDHTDRRGNTRVTIADSAEMVVTSDKKYLLLTLYNGRGYEELKDSRSHGTKTYPMQKNEFEKQRVIIDMSDFEFSRTDDELFKHSYQMKNLSQLSEDVDSLYDALYKRKSGFLKNFFTTNILKYDKVVPEVDSATITLTDEKNKKLDSLRQIEIDSFYASLTSPKKRQVLSTAENYAISAKSYVNSVQHDLRSRIKLIKRHEIEWHKKFTLAFACFIFFFIGAPLGAIIRKGGLGLPVVISVVFFIIYYVISLIGEKFVREAILPAWQGMWIASVILLPLGIFLSYKAAHDSVILDIYTYWHFLGKIRDKLTGRQKGI
jgi:lipopolysaccharide export system permease protein